MNDGHLEDLKQFIDGRVGQAEPRLREESLDGFQGVGEAIEATNHRIDQFDTSKRPA
ncbi:hypothetical protein HYW36_00355 [Candidatus Saccharibacteria bacterium]|nr:hypothetical protein [Candidatus Saccharibacteria bacterium]